MNEYQEKLGMAYSTARSMLLKRLLFDLANKTGRDVCYRCEKRIAAIEEFSMDHILPWRASDNPLETFSDPNNVLFSHLDCNSLNGAKKPKARRSTNTGFKGVTFDAQRKSNKKHRAVFWQRTDGKIKQYHLGWYETAKEAALVYDQKADEVHGGAAVTNKSMSLL